MRPWGVLAGRGAEMMMWVRAVMSWEVRRRTTRLPRMGMKEKIPERMLVVKARKRKHPKPRN